MYQYLEIVDSFLQNLNIPKNLIEYFTIIVNILQYLATFSDLVLY